MAGWAINRQLQKWLLYQKALESKFAGRQEKYVGKHFKLGVVEFSVVNRYTGV